MQDQLKDLQHMTQGSRRITLFLLVAALLSLILLSASLSNLQLHAGQPFPGTDTTRLVKLAESPAESLAQIQSGPSVIARGIFALVLLILIIYIPARLITLVNLRSVLIWILIGACLLLLLSILSQLHAGQPQTDPNDAWEANIPQSHEVPVSPLGRPSQVFTALVGLGLLMGTGLLTYLSLKNKLHPPPTEQALLQVMERAVHALRDGEEFASVIVRCYLKMTLTLKQEKKIERTYYMTTREFEDWLSQEGFPAGPVHRLTRLFEKARYGGLTLSQADEEAGMTSLNEIIQYCLEQRD